MVQQEQQLIEEKIKAYCTANDIALAELKWQAIPFSGEWGISTSLFQTAANEARAGKGKGIPGLRTAQKAGPHSTLRHKKELFKQAIKAGNLRNMSFRPINDPGECATLLTVQFPDEKITNIVTDALHSKSLFYSGWHVYNNMEQLIAYTDPSGKQPYYKNMLPVTDAILLRSVNLSVGVIDKGLGADFGINVLSTEDEIYQKAEVFVRILRPIVG